MNKENIKTFYLKYLTFLAIPIALFIAYNRLQAYNQKQNFTVINERQTVIVQLPNTEYLEFNSKNDVVTDYVQFTDKPFYTNTRLQKISGLENTLALVDSHTELIENGPIDTRLLELKQKSATDLNLTLTATTSYRYIDGLMYSTQIDYTNVTNFNIEGNTVTFTDKGCTTTIEGEGITYKIYENNQTVILTKPYQPVVIFDLDISVTCQ